MAQKRKRSDKEKTRSRERVKEHYARTREDPEAYAKLLEYNRQWAKSNPQKMLEYGRKWRAKQSPAKRRAIWVKSKYKLTDEQYEQILQHDGHCDSCGDKLEQGRNTHIDHCHETGRFRGILCRWCNIAAGAVKDDPDKASALADYLERVGKLT